MAGTLGVDGSRGEPQREGTLGSPDGHGFVCSDRSTRPLTWSLVVDRFGHALLLLIPLLSQVGQGGGNGRGKLDAPWLHVVFAPSSDARSP